MFVLQRHHGIVIRTDGWMSIQVSLLLTSLLKSQVIKLLFQDLMVSSSSTKVKLKWFMLVVEPVWRQCVLTFTTYSKPLRQVEKYRIGMEDVQNVSYSI